MSDKKKSSSKYMSEAIGLGIALGASLGIILGVLIDNLSLGIAIGPALGVALGSAYGSFLEKKHQDELPLNKQQMKARNLVIMLSVLLFTISAVLLVYIKVVLVD